MAEKCTKARYSCPTSAFLVFMEKKGNFSLSKRASVKNCRSRPILKDGVRWGSSQYGGYITRQVEDNREQSIFQKILFPLPAVPPHILWLSHVRKTITPNFFLYTQNPFVEREAKLAETFFAQQLYYPGSLSVNNQTNIGRLRKLKSDKGEKASFAPFDSRFHTST